MNALKNSLQIWKAATAGVTFRDRLMAFLCARLGSLAPRRQKLGRALMWGIGKFARDGQIEVRFRITEKPMTVSLRQGNRADYLVFGEMVMGNYSLPARIPGPPAMVIDDGANIGLFSLFAHAHFPGAPITCYEPDADNVRQLRRNLGRNQINARVVNKALWSRSGELYFHPAESYSGYVNEVASDFPVSCAMPEMADGGWLKLDIEGAEYEVLPEIFRRAERPGLVSMEIHDFNRRGGPLLDLLRDSGYVIDRPLDADATCVSLHAVHSR